MITLSPLSGFKNVTTFSFEISPSASDPIIDWNDDTFSYTNTATHIYSNIGHYNVIGGSCLSTSSFYVSVYDGDYFTNKISVERDAISCNVSTHFNFNINLSSNQASSTVILYSSGSNSYPYLEKRTIWSHLNPEWEFKQNDVNISQLCMTGTPVYSGTNILGYTACSSVTYLDDMPGNPVLFFTVAQTEQDIPVNSRVYSAFTHSVCAVDPDKLFITSDGLIPLNSIQWSDHNIPFVVSVGSSEITASNILHYVSGSIIGVQYPSDCYGQALTSAEYNVANINLTDDKCFKTGGYSLSTFFIPNSALNEEYNVSNYQSCNYDPEKLEFYKNRKTPKNVALSATASISYHSNNYTLTGISNNFDVVSFGNRHEFYRKGEDVTIYDVLKNSLPFDVTEYVNFNSYLSAIAGEGDSFGKIYDKIFNFNIDHSDIDLCSFDFLKSKAEKLGYNIDDYGLSFPEELKRVFNFSTIPLQKLIGTRCVCNTNFIDCENCVDTNICKLCNYDKKSNLGDQLLLSDYITAGDVILYKEDGGKYFNFFAVPEQDSIVYKISTLSAEPFNTVGIRSFCFYKWNSAPQNNPIQSFVNYKDERNSLNPALSSESDWFGDNGVIEEIFNYILTKNLIDN